MARPTEKEAMPENALSDEQRKYILEDLSPSLIRKMMRERSRDDNYLDICGKVLEAFLGLMLAEMKAGYYNQDFLFACRSILDYDCMLHKFSFQIADEALQALYTKGSGQAWRKDLKEGDCVDSLLHTYDRLRNSRSSGWTRARVVKVDEDKLHLEYPTELQDADRVLDRWSVELAPYESKTKEAWEWKAKLQPDQ
jgi:hypothetical protein